MAKLSNKILIVAAIPLLFELTILSLLLVLSERLATARREEAHAKEMALHFNRLSTLQMQRSCLMIVRHTAKDNRDVMMSEGSRYANMLIDEMNQIQSIPNLSQEESTKLAKLRTLTEHISEVYNHAMHENDDTDFEKGLLALGLDRDITQLLKISQSLGDDRLQRVGASRDMFIKYEGQLRTVIYVAALISVATALSVAFWLYKSTSSRLNTLVENTKLIAIGSEPRATLNGTDEIAQVNKLYQVLHTSLTELREKERALLDNARDVICAIDSDLRVSEINEAIELLTGFTRQEVEGRRVADMVLEQDHDNLLDALEKKAQASPAPVELTMLGKAGNQVDTEWSISKSKDGRTTYAVIHDITARKDVERIKQDFRSMISHDLRTPLANMRVVLELVALNQAYGPIPNEARDELQTLLGSLNRLIVLVNNLLDMEKLDFMPESIDKRTVETGNLVDEALLSVNALARQKEIGIDVSVQRETAVCCDSEKLVQVLVNLLSNAINFSPRGERIRVSAIPNKGQIKFEVEDRGGGVPEDQLEKIFDKYHQVKDTAADISTGSGTGGRSGNAEGGRSGNSEGGRSDTPKAKSSGLGLAICKQIVTLHGGTIGARNVAPRGSAFWFKVPLE